MCTLSPSGDRVSKLHFSTPVVRPIFLSYGELCGRMPLDGPHCSPFATCGRYSAGRAGHGRRGRAPKTPTLLDVLWVMRETKTSKSRTLSSASAGLEPRGHSVTDTRIVGGGIMSKRNLVIEEGSVEALARLQKQDEEFCRRLRAAIETGRECCPTTVFTEPCPNRPVSNYMGPDLMRGYRAC